MRHCQTCLCHVPLLVSNVPFQWNKVWKSTYSHVCVPSVPGFIAGGYAVAVYEKVQVTWKPPERWFLFCSSPKNHTTRKGIFI